MLSRKILIKDSEGKPSATVTAFILGFLMVNAKFLLGGLWGLVPITGVEYGAAIGALGAIYVLRKQTSKKEENKDG